MVSWTNKCCGLSFSKFGSSTGNDSSSGSDFDSDNSDIDETKSSFLSVLQNKSSALSSASTSAMEVDSGPSGSSSTASGNNESKQNSKLPAPIITDPSNPLKFKTKLELNDGASTSGASSKGKTGPPGAKRPRLPNEGSAGRSDQNSEVAMIEDAVRRYLMRKPMCVIDLLQKFKNKVTNKEGLGPIIVSILKKLNPEKTTIKGKQYFSLKPK